MERIQYRRPLQESHCQRLDIDSILPGEHLRDTDVSSEAGAGLYLWQDQYHRDLIGAVLCGRGDEGLERLAEQEESEKVGGYE